MIRATAGRPHRPHWSWPFPRWRFGFVLHRQAGAAPARFQRRQRRRQCSPDSSPFMGVKAKIPHFALERVKLMVEAGQFMIQQGRARVFLGGSFQEAGT